MQTEDTVRSPKLQVRATNQITRGAPALATDQRGFVLQKLREADERGVSRSTFIFGYHITQCGARLDELKRQGYQLESQPRSGDRYVTSVRRGEPGQPKPLPNLRQKKLFRGRERAPPESASLFDWLTNGGTR